MADWLAEVDKEQRPLGNLTLWQQYTVSLDPTHEWHRDEQGRPLYRRFSCASFVLKVYEEGLGRPLISISDPIQLPEVELNTVAHAYGDMVQREPMRRRINLEGAPPWRIVLAGYVLHALNRLDTEIRTRSHSVTGVKEAEFP